jgi:SAM-dependent methyltransferase
MTEPGNFFQPNWSAYYQATAVPQSPHDTLREALVRFAAERPPMQQRTAVDLGCGTGRDTVELLRCGWRVLAVDNQWEALTRTRANIPPEHQEAVETRLARLEDVELPAVDLVNASYSLPFCHPAHFPALWQRIVTAIRQGGRFSGHFFGERDTWADNPNMTFHTDAQVSGLFTTFELEQFLEHENDDSTATGDLKHWHVFSVVARKLE